jgi:hypothetical protein
LHKVSAGMASGWTPPKTTVQSGTVFFTIRAIWLAAFDVAVITPMPTNLGCATFNFSMSSAAVCFSMCTSMTRTQYPSLST